MKILDTLHNTKQGSWSYIWRATLISLIPSLCIAFIIGVVFPAAEEPDFGGSPIFIALGLLVLSPVIETLTLWLGISLIQRFVKSTSRIAIVSAVIWAIIHSLAAPVWGLGVIWPFYVFSVSFIEWRKTSKWKAVSVTAIIHMLQNLVPTIALLIESA